MREPLPDIPRVEDPEIQGWGEDVVEELRRRARLRVRDIEVVGGDDFDLYPPDDQYPPAAVLALRAREADDAQGGVQIASALVWTWKADPVRSRGYCRVTSISGLTSATRYIVTIGVVEVF